MVENIWVFILCFILFVFSLCFIRKSCQIQALTPILSLVYYLYDNDNDDDMGYKDDEILIVF